LTLMQIHTPSPKNMMQRLRAFTSSLAAKNDKFAAPVEKVVDLSGVNEVDLSVNIWSLQFVDHSMRTKFSRALEKSRKNVIRTLFTINAMLLVFHAIKYSQEPWLCSAHIILAFCALAMISVTFTWHFRKLAEMLSYLGSIMALLTETLINICAVSAIEKYSSYFLGLLGMAFAFSLQMNFMITSLFLIVQLTIIVVCHRPTADEEDANKLEAGSYVFFSLCSLGLLGLTYLLLLGRINLFVLMSKGQIVEQKVWTAAKQLQTQWIAQVAHDLGTPLATFSLGNQMLRATPLTPEQDDILATQECAVELMTITRNKGLDVAKLESGQALRPHLRPLDVRELVETKCRRIMIGYGAETPMYFEVAPEVAPRVVTDRDWVWEMLINFLNNAQKFTQTGRIVVRVGLVPEGKDTRKKGDGGSSDLAAAPPVNTNTMLRFEVADTGIGIGDEQKRRLFRPYSQLQRGAGGTGLGLHSVLQKARALGGGVGVADNSLEASGSVFWFDIPYVPDTTIINDDYSPCNKEEATVSLTTFKARPSNLNKDRIPEYELSKGTLLLVDDQKTILKFMSTSLRNNGFQVETATNGLDAYNKMISKVYQAVILDDQMPQMNGQEVCQKVRRHEDMEKSSSDDSHRQYIVMVCGAPDSIPDDTGYDQIINKPVDIKHLLHILHTAVCSPLSTSEERHQEQSASRRRRHPHRRHSGASSPSSCRSRSRSRSTLPSLGAGSNASLLSPSSGNAGKQVRRFFGSIGGLKPERKSRLQRGQLKTI